MCTSSVLKEVNRITIVHLCLLLLVVRYLKTSPWGWAKLHSVMLPKHACNVERCGGLSRRRHTAA